MPSRGSSGGTCPRKGSPSTRCAPDGSVRTWEAAAPPEACRSAAARSSSPSSSPPMRRADVTATASGFRGRSSLHRRRGLRSLIDLRGLPQLDPISFRVGDPGEPTVLVVLPLRHDRNSFPPKRREHGVQVLHAVVDHERRAVAEVLRVGGEDGPDRVPFDLAVLPAAPREEGHRVLDPNPQMSTVPFDHRLRILRLEEDASEARHAGPMLPFGHRPGNGTPQYEREVRADAERRAMRWSFTE